MTPDTNSYTYLIREGIITRVKKIPFFCNVTRFGRTRMKTVQYEHLPYFGCYFINEDLKSDGDGNAGEPRFIHEARYGFSYMMQNTDDEIAERQLDTAHWALMNGLLRPQNWHRFDNNVRIEAVTRGRRQHVYGNTALNNETPIAELQQELSMTYRSMFEPIVEDVLEKLHVTVGYPWPYDPDAYDPPFTIEYDLPTG